MTQQKKNLANKTLKREYAAALMFILIWSIWNNNVEMVEVIIWPILSYVAAVSGLHIFKPNSQNDSSDEYVES